MWRPRIAQGPRLEAIGAGCHRYHQDHRQDERPALGCPHLGFQESQGQQPPVVDDDREHSVAEAWAAAKSSRAAAYGNYRMVSIPPSRSQPSAPPG